MISCNRQKSDVACALDRFGDVTLVSCTVTGNSAWHDFAALGDEKAKRTWLFVVDYQVFLGAETAYFTTLEWTTLARSAIAAGAACGTLTRAACRAGA